MRKNQVLRNLAIFGLILGLNVQIFAMDDSEGVWVTLGSDAVTSLQQKFSPEQLMLTGNKSLDGVSLVQVLPELLPEISHFMHEKFHRCGGFMLHETLEEAEAEVYNEENRQIGHKLLLQDYNINQAELVRPLIAKVEEKNIASVIRKLSSFQNRYYKSSHGQDSQKWLKEHWENLIQGRNDAKVEFITHRSWPQPSVVMTIQGKSAETIIIGGHADSIAGYWNREGARAPGADDNASGIATITEVIRLLVDSSYRPEKTIKFMAYAAEEVGLLGSKDIAKSMRQMRSEVIGVMQLDMTNYNGSPDISIVSFAV